MSNAEKASRLNWPHAVMGGVMLAWGVAVLAVSGCGASGLKYTVPPADVAQLEDGELEPLQASEADVSKAKLSIERAQQAVDDATAEVGKVKALIKGKEADLSAARAEAAAAQANQQEGRYDDAMLTEDRAKDAIKLTEAQLGWAKAVLKAKKARLEQEEYNLALQEANRELIKVTTLAKLQKPAAENYAVVDFRLQAEKAHKDYMKEVKVADRLEAASEKAHKHWQRMKKRMGK